MYHAITPGHYQDQGSLTVTCGKVVAALALQSDYSDLSGIIETDNILTETELHRLSATAEMKEDHTGTQSA